MLVSPVNVRLERAQRLGEHSRQHIEPPLHQVGGSATRRGFFVKSGACRYEVRHIGNVHAHLWQR